MYVPSASLDEVLEAVLGRYNFEEASRKELRRKIWCSWGCDAEICLRWCVLWPSPYRLSRVHSRDYVCQGVFTTVRVLGQLADMSVGDIKGEGPSGTLGRLNAKSFGGRFGVPVMLCFGVKSLTANSFQEDSVLFDSWWGFVGFGLDRTGCRDGVGIKRGM